MTTPGTGASTGHDHTIDSARGDSAQSAAAHRSTSQQVRHHSREMLVGLAGRLTEWSGSLLPAAAGTVFVIQHTTNRQAHATALKLDELIRVTEGAGNNIIGIENRELHDQEDLGNTTS